VHFHSIQKGEVTLPSVYGVLVWIVKHSPAILCSSWFLLWTHGPDITSTECSCRYSSIMSRSRFPDNGSREPRSGKYWTWR